MEANKSQDGKARTSRNKSHIKTTSDADRKQIGVRLFILMLSELFFLCFESVSFFFFKVLTMFLFL